MSRASGSPAIPLAPNRPMLSLWFGNFFEPFYSDEERTRIGIAETADLGFTTVNLDSKPWADFFARYRGEPASQYVGMQELMMAEARRLGLDHTCLSLYLCGDNLYPGIRDEPPVRGEDAIRPDGSSMGTYKYWSPVAQESMVEHVRGLLRLYGQGMRRTEDGRVVLQTMFDPIPKPSFDREGRAHYMRWLRDQYGDDIATLNARYGTSAATFDDLDAEEYWLRPHELDWVGCARPSADDFARQTADLHRWLDNQRYLADVMVDYFASMAVRWRQLEPPLFVEPVLHQWGFFFNPPGAPDWQTGQRGLDVYRLAPHVDGVLFMAAPLNAEDMPDASALSLEGAIARTANHHRPFTGGLYLGRHLNVDVYATVPPAEAIATHVANGATRLHAYGYSGLDDGGVLFRMDDIFKDSLRTGNQWASEVIPQIEGTRSREIAILFPAEMSLLEPLDVDAGGRHRMDLLGWYRQLTDLGWHVDVLHPDQVLTGALADYRNLVVPTNSLDHLSPDTGALADALRQFVHGGGTVLHGPRSVLVREAFGVVESAEEFDCITWREAVIPHGWSTVSFSTGQPVATYIGSGRAAWTLTQHGAGSVHSFGFEYGYAYSRRSMPIVPPQYGRREMHPVVLLEQTPVAAVLGTAPDAPLPALRGVESARFGDRHLVLVNHRSSPVDISTIPTRRSVAQVDAGPGILAAHSGVFIEIAR